MRYSRCRNRAIVDVGLSVGVSVTVSVSFNKVRVVVVLSYFYKTYLLYWMVYQVRTTMRSLNMMARKCIVWWSSDP